MQRWLSRKWALWCYLAISMPLLAAAPWIPSAPSSVMQAVVPTLAGVALATGVHLQRPEAAMAWWLITGAVAVGATAHVAAAVAWVSSSSSPPEWYGPLAGAVSAPLFIGGIVLLGRHRGRRDTADMLDATVIALAIFLVLFAVVIHPALPTGNEAIAAAVIFPLAGLLVFAMGVWLALSLGVPTPSIGLLLLGVVLGVAGTISLMLPAVATGIVEAGPLTQLLFGAYAISLGAAGLHPSLGRALGEPAHRHDSVSRRRLALLAMLAVVAPVAWGGQLLFGSNRNSLTLIVPVVVSAALLLVVIARLGLTAGVAQRRAAELARRSEDLAQAVQEQDTLQRQLRYQALHDPLTGLANRVVLAERMEWALSRPNGGGHALAVIDLDRFKDVNDTFGHAIGDQLLVEVSHRLLATMPTGATLARFGGDEFAALVENVSETEAHTLSERMRQALRRPYRIGDHDLYLSASVGLLTTDESRPVPTPSEALRDADLALYSAKSAGKDRVEPFRPELRTARASYRRLRTGLQRALSNNEMTLHYQPVVHLGTGRFVAVEALLRWAPSGRPPQPPSTFITVAEDAGLIGPIGAWVMHQACRDVRPWYEEHGVAVTVNVSPRQLEDPSFADMVLDALHTAGVPGDALIIEITETSLVATSTANQAMDQLHRLRTHRVRVAIDDFGTGYSSLANVARLPVDIVKIDSSFVQNPGAPGDGAQSWAFTKAILNMVDALHLQAVAEGVETLEQAEALRRLKCPLAQGYLFARPMPPSVFAQELGQSNAAAGRLGKGRSSRARAAR